MTDSARINYQKGIPENKMYEWTDYTVQSFLDAWVVAHTENRRRIQERLREKQQQEALKEYIKDDVKKELDKTVKSVLTDTFKDFKPHINIKI